MVTKRKSCPFFVAQYISFEAEELSFFCYDTGKQQRAPTCVGGGGGGGVCVYSPFRMVTKRKLCFLNSESSLIESRVIPDDLIPDILLNLPVKSLLKFKCVSKQWLSLITSPEFIKSHLCRSSSEGRQQLFFNTFHGGFMRYCSLSSALLDPCCTRVSDVVEYPCKNPNTYFEIVGIANGLVCLAIGENQLCTIWNPALRKYKHLGSTKYRYKVSDRALHGFGYDESNDDYKVIKMRCVYNDSNRYTRTEAEVYSLRADTWRIIGVDLNGVIPRFNGSYANGKIMWIANREIAALPVSTYRCKIVGLDLKRDKYEEVDGPVNESNVYNSGITVLDGRIYVTCYHYLVKTDLWMMDKFGVEESWSKVFSIPYDDGSSVPLVIKPSYGIIKKVVCITRNGQVIIQDGQEGVLLVYSCKDKEFRRIQLANLYSFNQVFVYAESWVSPDSFCSTR